MNPRNQRSSCVHLIFIVIIIIFTSIVRVLMRIHHLMISVSSSHLASSILSSYFGFMLLLEMLNELNSELILPSVVRLKLVWVTSNPLQVVLLIVCVILAEINVLDLDHFVKYYLNLEILSLISLLIVNFKMLTDLEFVVFHVGNGKFKFILESGGSTLEEIFDSFPSRLLQKLILKRLSLQLLRVLLVLLTSLVESHIVSLIDCAHGETYLLSPFNKIRPLICVVLKPLLYTLYSSS
jgi:hypothetical protein